MGEPGAEGRDDAAAEVVGDPPAGGWAAPHRLRDLSRSGRIGVAAVVAAVVAGFVAVGVQLASQHQVLIGDNANIAILSRSVFADRRLFGVLTSSSHYVGDDYYNPGPIHLYWLNPFIRVFGAALGTQIATLTASLAAILLGGWSALRTAGPVIGAAAMVAMVLAVDRVDPGTFGDVLNTRAVLPSLLCCFFLAWAISAGDTVWLPVLAAAGTFVVQTTVAFAPLVVAISACGCVLGLARVRANGWPPRTGRRVAVAVAVGVVLWAPPLYDQLRYRGNLLGLLRADIPHRGFSGAWDALGGVFDADAALDRGATVLHVPNGWTAVGLVLLAVAGWAAWSRWVVRPATDLLWLSGAVIAGAMASGFLTPPDDTNYLHFLWAGLTSSLVLFSLLVVAGSALERSVRPRVGTRPRAARWLAGGAGVLLAVIVLPAFVRSFDVAEPYPDQQMQMAATRALTAQVLADIDHDTSWALVQRGEDSTSVVIQGMVNLAQERGIDIRALKERPDDGRQVLVLVQGAVADADVGERVAAFQPPGPHPEGAATVDDEVASFARANGPVVLSAIGEGALVTRIDGVEPELCPGSYERDPDRLLDLSPAVLASLYARGGVTSPELPPELEDRLRGWLLQLPMRVVRTPELDDQWTGSGELLLSRDSC